MSLESERDKIGANRSSVAFESKSTPAVTTADVQRRNLVAAPHTPDTKQAIPESITLGTRCNKRHWQKSNCDKLALMNSGDPAERERMLSNWNLRKSKKMRSRAKISNPKWKVVAAEAGAIQRTSRSVARGRLQVWRANAQLLRSTLITILLSHVVERFNTLGETEYCAEF